MRCTGKGGTSFDSFVIEVIRELRAPIMIYPDDGLYINQSGSPVSLHVQPNRFIGSSSVSGIEVSINNGAWQSMSSSNGLDYKYGGIEKLSPGFYLWRARALDGSKTSPPTSPRSFTVFIPEPPQPIIPTIVPPSGTTNITVKVVDEKGFSIPRAKVNINPGSNELDAIRPIAFPINQGFPYTVTVSNIPSYYSLSSTSPDGRAVSGGAAVYYQVSNEPSYSDGLNSSCSSNQARCKQVLNSSIHSDINRSADPSAFNYFISLDQSDDSYTFIFKDNTPPNPRLDTLSVSPASVDSEEAVTISWTGENLGFCNPASSPSIPSLKGPLSSNEKTKTKGGPHEFTAPTVSVPTTYRLGLDCNNPGENFSEAQISPNNITRAPTLTVNPKNDPIITDPIIPDPTDPIITIPKTPTTKTAPSISGFVYTVENGVVKGVQAQVIINNKYLNTNSDGTFSFSKEVHGLKYAGQFKISTNYSI